MNHPLTDLKLTLNVIWNLIIKTDRIYILIILFILILFTLQWLFNLDQLVEILFGDNNLSVASRVDFLFDGFYNIFRYANDFVPISMILIAFLQAISLTLILSFRKVKKFKSQQALPLGLGFLGVGCVACGGSILTPILGLIATNASVTLAEGVSKLLLLLALVISYLSMNRIAYIVANTIPSSK